MTKIDKIEKSFSDMLSERLYKKQSRLQHDAGEMGHVNGSLLVPDVRNYVYVTIGLRAIAVYYDPDRITPKRGVKVWVGYTPEEPSLYQVLSYRTDMPQGLETPVTGYVASRKYIDVRAITWLRIGMSETPGMYIDVFRGRIRPNGVTIHIPREPALDISAHVPSTPGKAAYVLITFDDSGNIVQTKGDEVNIEDLVDADIPADPAGTAYCSGAVRVYNGQEQPREADTNTDFVDLRFTGRNANISYAWADLTGKPTTWDELWAELTGMEAGVAAVGDGLYVRKFSFAAAPTVNDDTSLGYMVTDEWFDTSTSTNYKLHDATDGAAVWLEEGSTSSGSGDFHFRIDGSLAVQTNVFYFLVTKDTTISKWYIACDDPGSASSTIFDVHLNGTTIFTTQANRPTLAYNDANGWAVSGTPDFVDFVEGDTLTIDIDQIATGAEGLTGAGQNGSGTFGFNLIVGSVDHVGLITPKGMIVNNESGGEVTIGTEYILLQDNKTQNTPGGTFTSGADQTRNVNTEVKDTGNNCSISANQITLDAGIYEVYIKCPAFRVNSHQAWLYNITDAAIELMGSSEFADSGADGSGSSSIIVGQITFATSKVFEIRHRCQTTGTTSGFGQEANFHTEVYTQALFKKVG